MSGKRWHAPSASATPWDGMGESSLTPSQAFVRAAHRRAYDHRHERPAQAGEADFFNSYGRDRCPRCGSASVSRRGLTASGIQRYRCASCGRSFTPLTGTIFEDHRLSPDDWFEFIYQALTFESMAAMTRLDRRSGTTTAYWMAKLFGVLRGVQDATVLSGRVQIDETMYPVAARDAAAGRAAMGAYSRNKICVAVGCDGRGRALAVRAGLGKLSKARCWEAYGSHIAPGSTLVHDRENSHSVLVARLGLASVPYRSSDLKGLNDRDNPLAGVNHMCFLVKEFLHRHSGFDRDGIDDWLNLFSVIVNPPADTLSKVAYVLDRAMVTPVSLRYRDFYSQDHS